MIEAKFLPTTHFNLILSILQSHPQNHQLLSFDYRSLTKSMFSCYRHQKIYVVQVLLTQVKYLIFDYDNATVW